MRRAVHTGHRHLCGVAQEAAHALPCGTHAESSGHTAHVGIVAFLRPKSILDQPGIERPVSGEALFLAWLQLALRLTDVTDAPPLGVSSPVRASTSETPQSFLEANFTAMAARIKKYRVEAGMYQCHSKTEETR